MSENIVLQQNEENVIVATFNITSENTHIKLQNLKSISQIDWGDGTVNNNLSHTYTNTGKYICKIYNVTSISKRAFYGCGSLTNITIPDSVTSIGDIAFSNCSSLTSITIPDSVKSIGTGALAGCSSLTSVILGDSIRVIENGVFANCSGLMNIIIPDSVTSIGYGAFQNCTSLTSITIPDSVTNIGDIVFSDCSNLTNITIPDSVTSIGYGAFFGCSSLTSVVIGDSVTSIGVDAFSRCSSLTSVEIGSGVTSIGNGMFSNCNSLTSITIPDSVTNIGNGAFNCCSSLTSITIPDSVTSIGAFAFEYCSSLMSITIPDSVTDIGDGAFYNCDSLTSITFKSLIPISKDTLSNSYLNSSTPTYYVPKESIEAYQTAWSGLVEPDKIQPDPDKHLINLEGLKTYHNALKERYLDTLATQEYVNELLVNKTDYLGTVSALPDFSDAGAGDFCRVSTEFVYDESTGEVAHVGDILIAVKDNPTQSIADWDLVHNELNSATLVTVGGVAQTSWDANTKVGFTDYAGSKAGVIKNSKLYGLVVSPSTGLVNADILRANEYPKAYDGTFISKGTLEVAKYDIVKRAITENDITLTDEESAKALAWIGAVPISSATSFQQSTNAEITELNQDVEELQQSTSAAENNILGLQADVGGSLGATLDFTIDNQTFVLTAVLKAKNGYVLSSQSVDLPLESVVVGGSYDEDAKTLVLRLQNGNNITIPVGDLVDGLISESEKGQPNGVATLGPDGIIPAAQLPTVKEPTWELINSVTVAPDTDGSLPQYVNFTEDSDGNPFELTDFYVYMSAGFTDSNSTVYMSINGVSSYCNFNAQFSQTELRGSVILKQNLSNGVIMFAGSHSFSGYAVDHSQNKYEIRFSVPPHASSRKIVNSVSLYTLLGTNKTWREGSSFELWGVRK